MSFPDDPVIDKGPIAGAIKRSPSSDFERKDNNMRLIGGDYSSRCGQPAVGSQGDASPPPPSHLSPGRSRSIKGGVVGPVHHRHRVTSSGDTSMSADSDRRPPKACRVCGDVATGYNFNVITCESCKAFFRRNAHKPKEFKCPYNDDCDVNAVSRRFCQKCRLRKCAAVGMKKEWILSDDQLKRRKNSRFNKPGSDGSVTSPGGSVDGGAGDDRHRSSDVMSPMSPPYSGHRVVDSAKLSVRSPVDSSQPSTPLTPRADSLSPPDAEPTQPVVIHGVRLDGDPGEEVSLTRGQLTGLISHYANKFSRKRATSVDQSSVPEAAAQVHPEFSPPSLADGLMPGHAQMIRRSAFVAPAVVKKLRMFDETIASALQPVLPDVTSALQQTIQGGEVALNYQLNTDERRMLDTTKECFTVLSDPLDPNSASDLAHINGLVPLDIFKVMNVTMRRLVKAAKKLPAFNDLSQPAKFALLKGGMIEMLTMRGVTLFNLRENCWRSPVANQLNVPASMFDHLLSNQKERQKESFIELCSLIEEDVRSDEVAIDIFVVTRLFNKDRDNVPPGDKDIIERHHQDYCRLLLRHLQSLHGKESQRKYNSLMTVVPNLRRISEESVTLFLGAVPNATEAEDLPKEFFIVNNNSP